ncbi:MAG: hypothetical protein H6721_09575 [Sandaracinus sp.]|nr:hypothetical protein [Sandaracinus sp.]MCB9632363.1 hypothetical protein [Sandaracinus sp.]
MKAISGVASVRVVSDVAMDAATLHRMHADELVAQLENGHPIDPRTLDDTEYRGTSLGLPGWMERLSWKKFRKTFHRDPSTGKLRGWNVRLVQNGLDAPDEPQRRRGEPHTFGHYEVVPTTGYAMPTWRGRTVWAHRGLMIDYGLGKNPPGLMRRVRDPLVAVRPGDSTLLLGWSYVDLGVARMGTPSFFTLELAGPLSHRA